MNNNDQSKNISLNDTENVSPHVFEDVSDDTDVSSDEIDQHDDVTDEADSNHKTLFWYIIQCYALHEQKVRDRILQMLDDEFKDVIHRVLLPEEETVEIKNNERKEKMKKMFPGYLFVQMVPSEEAWYLLRRLPGVAKLVGTKNEPTPVSGDEINRILRQLGEKTRKIEVDFELNETIKVISGPFRGYPAAIAEIYPERGKLRAMISIFGRETPVDLDFDQIEKDVSNK